MPGRKPDLKRLDDEADNYSTKEGRNCQPPNRRFQGLAVKIENHKKEISKRDKAKYVNADIP